MKQLKAVAVLAASLAIAGAAAPAFAMPADGLPILGNVGGLESITGVTNGITDVADVADVTAVSDAVSTATSQPLGTDALSSVPNALPLGANGLAGVPSTLPLG